MEGIKKILEALLSEVTVSSHEFMGGEAIRTLCAPYFDEIREDKLGSYVLVKKCGKENAKRLLLDAHYDQVGFMVSDIKDGGFLKVVNIGGLDARVLPSTEVIVHGKEKVYGIVTSTPPHLKKSSDKAIKLDDLMIDTGYSKEKIDELVRIGDIVSFKTPITYLQNNVVVASGLDDKACLAGLLHATMTTDKSELKYDVYITASAQEETGKFGPARVSFDIVPDMAIIADVNFARGEGIKAYESIEMGKGSSIDISSLTDRKLTKKAIELFDREKITYQKICEPSYTGTNNDGVVASALGVRTLLFSVPLKSMHSPSESVCLDDICSLSKMVSAILKEEL